MHTCATAAATAAATATAATTQQQQQHRPWRSSNFEVLHELKPTFHIFVSVCVVK